MIYMFYNTINNLDTNLKRQYLKILTKQEILNFNNMRFKGLN